MEPKGHPRAPQHHGGTGTPPGWRSGAGAACPYTLPARGRRVPAELAVPMEPRWQYQFRVIMLGDSTVGKSSLLRRYTEGVFLDAVNQTVGVDFYVQFVELEPGLRVKLQFWDTAGQERFRWVPGVGRAEGAGCPPGFLGCWWDGVTPAPGRAWIQLHVSSPHLAGGAHGSRTTVPSTGQAVGTRMSQS